MNIRKLSGLTAAVMLALSTLPAAALDFERDEDFFVSVDGYEYEGEVILVSDYAYVALREFSTMADNSVVSWDEDRAEATVTTDSLELHAVEGEDYIEANGRILWCEEGIFTYGDVMYAPLRQIAKAFGFECDYDPDDHGTYLTRRSAAITPDYEYYDEEDLYWLSKIINAESGAEPFLGKIAVGNVVLNRVASDEFPSSVYDVIFDTQNGVQFTPTANGAIEEEPCEDSIAAAKICLEDNRLSDDILYFLNEKIAASLWIVENCTYVMTIGSHDFYTE